MKSYINGIFVFIFLIGIVLGLAIDKGLIGVQYLIYAQTLSIIGSAFSVLYMIRFHIFKNGFPKRKVLSNVYYYSNATLVINKLVLGMFISVAIVLQVHDTLIQIAILLISIVGVISNLIEQYFNKYHVKIEANTLFIHDEKDIEIVLEDISSINFNKLSKEFVILNEKGKELTTVFLETINKGQREKFKNDLLQFFNQKNINITLLNN